MNMNIATQVVSDCLKFCVVSDLPMLLGLVSSNSLLNTFNIIYKIGSKIEKYLGGKLM